MTDNPSSNCTCGVGLTHARSTDHKEGCVFRGEFGKPLHQQITPETDPANATDADHLKRMAYKLDRPAGNAEFNFPAGIIQAVSFARDGVAPLDLDGLERDAEEGMLQLAFLNEGYTVPSSFLVLAVAAGWRYRIGKGFYREGGRGFALEAEQ